MIWLKIYFTLVSVKTISSLLAGCQMMEQIIPADFPVYFEQLSKCRPFKSHTATQLVIVLAAK